MRCGGGGGGVAVSCERQLVPGRNLTTLPACSPPREQDDDAVAIDGEIARALHSRALRVADVVEPADEFGLAHALAGLQGQRPREDSRDGAIAFAVQALVDDAAE